MLILCNEAKGKKKKKKFKLIHFIAYFFLWHLHSTMTPPFSVDEGGEGEGEEGVEGGGKREKGKEGRGRITSGKKLP